MKRSRLNAQAILSASICAALCLGTSVCAETATGNWFGIMNGHNLSFAHIQKTGKGYTGWFEVHEAPAWAPDPNTFHVPFDSLTVSATHLSFKFTMPKASGVYDGDWDAERKAWVGAVLSSGGNKGVLALARTDAKTLSDAKLPPPHTVNDPARMDEIIQAYVQNEAFMGTVLVARGDEILLDKAYGFANLEWRTPNTTGAKFGIGSMTKQFTAAAILLLEERGKLKTSDLISQYLPDTPAAWNKMTIHNLLTHTSGLPNFTHAPNLSDIMVEHTTPERTVARFRDLPLDFPTDSQYAYSNSSYILLGQIIEKVSGQSYKAFLQDNIFIPLHMADTYYDDDASLIPEHADGYVNGAYGLENAPYTDTSWAYAAGGLISTTHDLRLWAQAVFEGQFLTPASLKKMTMPYKKNYGYGVWIRASGGHAVMEHGGNVPGFNSDMAYYPDDKLTVIVLDNIEGNAASAIASRLASVSHGDTADLPVVHRAIAIKPEVLATYIGTYVAEPDFNMSLTLENGRLIATPAGEPKAQLFPESETRFFAKLANVQIEFFKDQTG